VETNTLTYRLKKLQEEGYIGKTNTGSYYLTSKGRLFTDRLNLSQFIPREFPRSITLIICRREGYWLLFRRSAHPLKDSIGLPYADVVPGESILDTASDHLKNRLGIQPNLAYAGSVYLTFYKDKELEAYNHANILNDTGKGPFDPRQVVAADLGEYFWVKDPDFTDPDYLPSLHDYARLLEKGSFPFFAELSYQL
jgi:hypothetical protein